MFCFLLKASGNCAAKHGLDLRCFIDERFSREDTAGARLKAVVRFGQAASIGNGLSAHGGAIETALDEATAELAKATQGVMCYTTSANFQLKQKVRESEYTQIKSIHLILNIYLLTLTHTFPLSLSPYHRLICTRRMRLSVRSQRSAQGVCVFSSKPL